MAFELTHGVPWRVDPTAPGTSLIPGLEAWMADTTTVDRAAAPTRPWDRLVMPGDFPDPTVVRIGDAYYASATSAEWGPVFDIYRSEDMHHWRTVGQVFPDQPPAWAEACYWAPELYYDNGRTYVCYTARKRGGGLCVAIASADRPEGPYRDHGPLVGQPMGSIDGMITRDESGRLYLIWKEDGNAYKAPTPIWAQPMNEAMTALEGEPVELMRNDAPWEGCLIEGVDIRRRGEWFYAFYSGNGCCGRCCNYAVGVARSRTLLGPWEKNPLNPILDRNETWRCPGHGTVVETPTGEWLMLHHAYLARGHEFIGRQGLVSQIHWDDRTGWPYFIEASPQAPPLMHMAALDRHDRFEGPRMEPHWQWPAQARPGQHLSESRLALSAPDGHREGILAQRTGTAHYTATTSVERPVEVGHTAGLAIIGEPGLTLEVALSKSGLAILAHREGRLDRLAHRPLPTPQGTGPQQIRLRLECTEGHLFRFAYSLNGQPWQELSIGRTTWVDGTWLPPWDRGLRVGLIHRQSAEGQAPPSWFEYFHLTHQPV